MKRQLQWTPRAERDLKAIERYAPRTSRRIHDAAVLYAEHERGDVVKLTGSDAYRLRVGDWRVIFTLEAGGLVIMALRVLNRRDAYR